MNTKLTDTVYLEKSEIEKEFKRELIAFLNEDTNTQFEEAFSEVEALLKGRWVVMEDDFCYDNNIKACWVGLCKESYDYEKFDSGRDLQEVLKHISKKFPSKHSLDLPTKTELTTSLTHIKSAPFPLESGWNNCPKAFPYALYKSKDVVQGFCIYQGSSGNNYNEGTASILLRLTTNNNFKISNQKVMFRWLTLGLIPTALKENSAYIKLLNIFNQYTIKYKGYKNQR